MHSIHSVSVNKLSSTILQRLSQLSHGYRGNTLPVLDRLINGNKDDGRFFYDGEAHYYQDNDIILGWCLTFIVTYQNKLQHIAYLYVDESYRNNGIGYTLANHVFNKYPHIAGHKYFTSCFDNFNDVDDEYLLN